MPSVKERADLFELLYKNDFSPNDSGQTSILPKKADGLFSQDLFECYKIVDAACRALNPDTHPTPEIMETFFRSVFDNWNFFGGIEDPEVLDQKPVLEPMRIKEQFLFRDDLSYCISVETNPMRLAITVEDPERVPAGVANIMCKKDGSRPDYRYQDRVMAAVTARCMENIQAQNARRAVLYARSWLKEHESRSWGEFEFIDFEAFIRLFPGLSVPKLSKVEATLLEWGA